MKCYFDEMCLDEIPFSTEKHIYIIPSVIHVQVTRPNLFTSEERFQQTIEQLDSIRSHDPDAIILLFEGAHLSSEEQEEFSKRVDLLCLCFTNGKIRHIVHEHFNKNLFEVWLFDTVLPLLIPYEWSHVCKFGGRYRLNHPDKKCNQLFSDKPLMKQKIHPFENGTVMTYVEPVFFSFPRKYYETFIAFFHEMHTALVVTNKWYDMERGLYDLFIKGGIQNQTEQFYITGYGATNKLLNEL